MEDEKIVDLFLLRQEDAISATAVKYGSRLRYIAKNITGNDSAAEECENDTYLHAWNSIPPHEPRTYFFAYLARLVRNCALDYCRRISSQKRSALMVELTAEVAQCIPGGISAEAEVDGRLLSQSIEVFLKRQTTLRRNLFLRRYWYMESVADIAQHCKITEGKVKVTLHRIRNDLKQHLEKEGYTP